ncbi:hypothetical protein QYS46_19560 [Klebsiella michiganensis]|nr:hypothetical protein [Klebsiella michiganensis]
MNRALAFFANIDWGDVAQASVDTLTMLGWSLGFTVLIGLPLGIVLYLSGTSLACFTRRASIACCRWGSTSCDRCRLSFY